MSRNQNNQDTWIIIAAFNEAQVISSTLSNLLDVFCNVVVVDDHSSDGTGEDALEAGAHVCTHPINLGQGAALQTGLSYALRHGARYLVTFDADGQHQPSDAEAFVSSMRNEGGEVILGSRFFGKAINMSRAKFLLLKVATLFTRITSGLKVTDTHNGLRCFSADAASRINIRQNRMAHASEILNQISELNLNYREMPCTIKYTEYSVAKGQKLSGAAAILSDLIIGKLYK